MSHSQRESAATHAVMPFMYPERSLEDLRVIHHLVSRLRAALHSGLLGRCGDPDAILTFEWEDASGLGQRIIHRMNLDVHSRERLYLVGYFGQRRSGADCTEIQEIDRELVADLCRHTDNLCYFTSALVSGQYGNLVVSRTEEARVRCNNDPRHLRAAREVSPRYYHSIRLHHGVMEKGLSSTRGALLTRTRYFAFDAPDGVPMYSVHDWTPPLSLAT